jgi:gamma-glutamyl hercynylcysteine S-oxide synthase
MRSITPLESMSLIVGPLALVYGSSWLRIPQWLRGAVSGSAAACRSKPPAPLVLGGLEDLDPVLTELADVEVAKPIGEPSLIDEMLSQSRYALLLRPQIIGNLTPDQVARTRGALADGMCMVPAGEVIFEAATVDEKNDEAGGRRTTSLRIDAYYLDRYPVTNAQFQQFVACGGYEQMAIWDHEVLAALLDFVDRTGHPGPRYWARGRYPAGEGNHPVVGVCWYEAWAYARWAGKRLATDAEWVKAGSWPVSLSGHPPLVRRYPWGDAMDRQRANLWGSGAGRTVGVDQTPGGVSVGGVQQLIGNVWEWTADPFVLDGAASDAHSSQPKMKSIHGGAFDTYLDTQATCQFRSGDHALTRKHNIGFRCAIGMCDFMNPQGSPEPTQAPQEALTTAETFS